jgi:acetyl esterase/lipase
LGTIGAFSKAVSQDLKPKVSADIVYGHKDGLAMTMDRFEPVGKSNGIGLMFMVSGGWVSSWNPPERMMPLVAPMLQKGYTIFAIRHGSSPRYLIPEIVSDVRLAHKHIVENAKLFQVDPTKLGVFGYSAGGHLSLMLGTTSNDRSGNAPRIAAVVAVFPPTDLRPYMEPSNPLREKFPALKFELSKGVDYSPLLQVTKDDAPVLMVHGDKDELVPLWHSEKMRDALKETGVANQLVVIEGAAHGFDAVGNKRMFDAMGDWFDQHLLGLPTKPGE